MKPPPFEYVRAHTLTEAAAMLAEGGEGTQILAGGQSLLPTLSFRLSHPARLIDINRVVDAAPLAECDGKVRFGAITRHADVERSALIRERVPLLSLAMPNVAHPAIRNRGTPCGSVALADPAAEIPACAVALNADIVLQGPATARSVPADQYFLGLYETARQPDEVVAELRFPAATPNQRFGFLEFGRRHGDFAIFGTAVVATLDAARIEELRFVVFGAEPTPRVSQAAAVMARNCSWHDLDIEEIASAVAAELDPMENSQGDAASKRQQARAITRRVLATLFAQDLRSRAPPRERPARLR